MMATPFGPNGSKLFLVWDHRKCSMLNWCNDRINIAPEKIAKTIVRLLRVSICDLWKADVVDGEPMNRVSNFINLRLVKVEIDHSEVCDFRI